MRRAAPHGAALYDLTRGLSGPDAEAFARIVLGHVTRPYPHKLDHVVLATGEELHPETLHPLFFGSFDWHSCVHGYWSLARLLRRHIDLPSAPEIRTLFDRQLVPEIVAGEVAYFARPSASGFERPYGWAWLLKLAAELAGFEQETWRKRCAPSPPSWSSA